MSIKKLFGTVAFGLMFNSCKPSGLYANDISSLDATLDSNNSFIFVQTDEGDYYFRDSVDEGRFYITFNPNNPVHSRDCLFDTNFGVMQMAYGGVRESYQRDMQNLPSLKSCYEIAEELTDILKKADEN